jgi:DNA-binding protein HU-beta
MNKQELITAMAEDNGLTKADNEKALNAMTEAIKASLSKKDSVQLIGFGTFAVSERAARTGRNPKTGESMQIEAKNIVKFKVGKALGDSVN